MNVLLATFKKHIDTQFPFIKGKKILVALSGGIDSVILTQLLIELKFDICLAHCNFNLRGTASDADEQFVNELGKQLNAVVFTTSFDTKKYAVANQLSIQMAARDLRYNWFHKIREENKLDFIATAHHLDDNLETFLINFTRGTGLNGLTGIPPVNKSIIRPLLPFSRDEIKAYALQNKHVWREDKSNDDTYYTRNKIRHQIIPLLKELNPNMLASFKKTTTHLNDSQNIINETIKSLRKKVVISENKGLYKISIEKLNEYPKATIYLFELLKTYGFTEWNDVENLLEAQSGKQLFSKTHRLIKDRNYLLLSELQANAHSSLAYEINESDTAIDLTDFKIEIENCTPATLAENDPKNTIYLDKEKLKFPLILRKWESGDYFYPLGMNGKKKISKYFKDEKYSLIEKENTWLLCSDGKIIWVVNKRQDARFSTTSTTKKILAINLIIP